MEMVVYKVLSNMKEGFCKNIEYYYDVGNEFYKLFLDDIMLYSSVIYGVIDDVVMFVDVLKKFKMFEV